MSWVFDCSQAALATRLVALSIANHADPTGSNAFCSVPTLAREAHVSERQVLTAIKNLVELGELIVWKGGGPPVRGGRLNRYELPKVPRWQQPEGMPVEQASDAESASLPNVEDEAKSCSFRHEVVKSAAIAPYIEPREQLQPPPTPPKGGDGVATVLSVLAAFATEDQRALQHLTGGMGPPPETVALALVAGGWSSVDEVPDVPAAIDAWLAAQPNGSYIKRRDIEKLGRTAVKNGHTAGEFLSHLCIANVATERGLELAKNRASRADLPGMSGMRGGGVGKRAQATAAGEAEYERRKAAKRRQRGKDVIDVESEEVIHEG